MPVVDSYIGLGSNLDDPRYQLEKAMQELANLRQTKVLINSSFYRSKPMGPQDQPDYINAVSKLSTALLPEELLDQLQLLENQHGRERKQEQWGPRTLDLDILLYGNQTFKTERLIIPHPCITDREFVLIPLQEIDAHLIIPGQGSVEELIGNLQPYELEKLN